MLKVKRLTVGKMQSNCYIVFDPDTLKAVIIDPGADANLIIEYSQKLNVDICHIILTHAHFDHMGASDALMQKFGCDLYVSCDDFQLLKDPHLNLSDQFDSFIIVSGSNIVTVSENTTKLIGHDFEFISTPGHTNGSVCIKTDNCIFTGDTLFYMSIGNDFPPYGSIQKEISSIKNKLFTLKGDYVCYPGHGEQTTLDFERKNNPYLGGDGYGY